MIAFGVFACQEGMSEDPEPSLLLKTANEVSQVSSVKDKLASRVAQNIAASLEDPLVLDFMKEKANLQFDGDYNFLVVMNADETLTTSSANSSKITITFGSIISVLNRSSSRTSEDAESFMDSISRFHPLLQVYVPELSDEINFTETEDYLVAYAPSPRENGVIPAYDKDGNYFELSADEVPSRPVIVISENERITAIPKNPGVGDRVMFECPMLAEAVFEDQNNTYYNTQDFLESNNSCLIAGGGGGGGGGSDPNCDRDTETGKDRLYRFKLNNMDIFHEIKDQWINGDLEMEVNIAIAPLNGTPFVITKIFYLNNSDVRDCGLFNCNTQWRYENPEIITWNPALYGERMEYVWSEYDPGTTQTQNFAFSNTWEIEAGPDITNTVNYSITTTDETDRLGSSIVEYCDTIGINDGFIYNTGTLSFQLQ